MSWTALRALRADLNPHGFGVLWDQDQRWMATTPDGHVIVAASPDQLRRAAAQIDGTTTAETAAFPATRGQGNEQR